jgi:hypothetical protein
VKLHRAVVLAVMILGAVALLGLMAWGALREVDGRSLAALAVVIVTAALAGAGFSWRRYFPR